MDKNQIKKAIQQNRINQLASSSKPNFPSVGQMAKNFSTDVVKTVKSVVAGNSPTSDQKEAERRKAICNTCEYFNKPQDRCTKCGCYMAFKVYVKASSCPMNKW